MSKLKIDKKVLISGLGFLTLSFTVGDENDFNCPDECGLYSAKDRIGPHLHDGCLAMSESSQCQAKFVMKDKRKKKKKKKKSTRIVGGVESKHPMPWMVRCSLIIIML